MAIDIRTAQPIEISLIDPNDYNPNVIKEDTLELLRRTIKRDGFLQPILIRENPKDPSKYIIIDGFHRHKVMSEFGEKMIPAIIVDKDDPLAKVATISMNKIRGNFDSLQLAEVLAELRKVYSDEQINEYLGYTKDELDSYTDLLEFNFEDLEPTADEAEAMDALVKDAVENNGADFVVRLNPEQLNIVNAAIKSYVKQYGGEEDNALHQICFSFIKEHGDEETQKEFGMI